MKSLRCPAISPNARRPNGRSSKALLGSGASTRSSITPASLSPNCSQYTEADYAAILGVNLAGFFHITQLAVAEMEKQGSGHVVQITTSLVDHANSRVPSVLASLTKGGLSAATKSLAIEYAKRGIRVNAVSPGVIKSPMHPVEAHAELDTLHPVGHMGEISDIVDAILYLETASFVTGEILHVDGGQSAGH
jgi:NAD(P)-dependent dehydrogenase (short-subunit alcohol dehydrogenase family)